MNNTETRTFSIGLLVLLLSMAHAGATTVSIADATVEPGGVITIPIMVSEIIDYGTGTISIEYDPSVAHITNVTDGPESHIAAHDVNNTLGLARISASNLQGVSGDIIFTNVGFKAVGAGSTPLNLNVILLGDISYNEIPVILSNGSLGIKDPQPPTSFSIRGYVYYENGTPCNNPTVNITNLNTYEEWQSETSGGSNYYRINLSSGVDLSANDVLRFDATDGKNSNVTDHTVTQIEVDAGGFGYNITLELPSSDTIVSIGSAEGSVGDSVNVSIDITDALTIGVMDIRVTYNASILNATDVANGSMIGNLPSPLVMYHIGYVDINISSTPLEAINGDGELFVVTFDVVGGNTGDSSPLNLEAEAYTTDLSPVALETEDGVVTVTGDTPDPAPYLVTYTISNTTISPNGDGLTDDTEIDVEFSEPVAAAILIENATGVIRTLYTGSGVTDPDPQTWDGTDDDGNIVAYGTYHVNTTMDDGVNPIVYDNTRSIMVANMSVATISIGNGSGIVTIPIAIEDGVNVGACDITLTFNASVVNVTGVTGGDMDVTMANLEHVHEGFVRIGAFQTSNPGLNGNIIFANVMFEPIGATGDTCSLNLSVTTFKDATPAGNVMPYIVRNGTYMALLNGDVNGDGVVDIHDAMYLTKHVLGKSGFEVIIVEAADVNDDKVIDIADSMYIAKHVLGITGFEELR